MAELKTSKKIELRDMPGQFRRPEDEKKEEKNRERVDKKGKRVAKRASRIYLAWLDDTPPLIPPVETNSVQHTHPVVVETDERSPASVTSASPTESKESKEKKKAEPRSTQAEQRKKEETRIVSREAKEEKEPEGQRMCGAHTTSDHKGGQLSEVWRRLKEESLLHQRVRNGLRHDRPVWLHIRRYFGTKTGKRSPYTRKRVVSPEEMGFSICAFMAYLLKWHVFKVVFLAHWHQMLGVKLKGSQVVASTLERVDPAKIMWETGETPSPIWKDILEAWREYGHVHKMANREILESERLMQKICVVDTREERKMYPRMVLKDLPVCETPDPAKRSYAGQYGEGCLPYQRGVVVAHRLIGEYLRDIRKRVAMMPLDVFDLACDAAEKFKAQAPAGTYADHIRAIQDVLSDGADEQWFLADKAVATLKGCAHSLTNDRIIDQQMTAGLAVRHLSPAMCPFYFCDIASLLRIEAGTEVEHLVPPSLTSCFDHALQTHHEYTDETEDAEDVLVEVATSRHSLSDMARMEQVVLSLKYPRPLRRLLDTTSVSHYFYYPLVRRISYLHDWIPSHTASKKPHFHIATS